MNHQKKVVSSAARNVVLPLLGALLGALPQSAQAQPGAAARRSRPVLTSKIAFVSAREGSSDVFLMNPDGSGQTRLSSDPGTEQQPAISPNGRQVVYVGNPEGINGSPDLFVVGADGSAPRRLTQTGDSEQDPEWSPDGRQLAFTVYPTSGEPSQITIAHEQSAKTRQLTDMANGAWQPTWSPNGNRIAFVSAYDAQDGSGRYLALFTIRADGSDVRFVIGAQNFGALGPIGILSSPSWSPDGSRLAFAIGNSSRGGVSTQIFEVNANGSGLRQVTSLAGGYLDSPSYSPDGSRIAFSSNANSEIYTINRDGGGLRQLTSNSEMDTQPSWSKGYVIQR